MSITGDPSVAPSMLSFPGHNWLVRCSPFVIFDVVVDLIAGNRS
jgi:hypothetical protein